MFIVGAGLSRARSVLHETSHATTFRANSISPSSTAFTVLEGERRDAVYRCATIGESSTPLSEQSA